MPDSAAARLSELLAPTRRLALVGLAKNTGKTETLAAILAEHARAGVRVGVTSIGRDGERHDVIDARIEKPAVRLQAGDLVASTGTLLRSSGTAHERLVQTGVRTPLGEVVIARLAEAGSLEVAGPSAASDVRAVSETMLELGAEQILIDGAVDRRAASSPAIADGLVIATGAVLSRELDEVVARTLDAIEVVRLPRTENGGESVVVARELVLGGEPSEIAELLEGRPDAARVSSKACSRPAKAGAAASCGCSPRIRRTCFSRATRRSGIAARESCSRCCARSRCARSRSTRWRRSRTASTRRTCVRRSPRRWARCPCSTCATPSRRALLRGGRGAAALGVVLRV
jgi:hypothetical protein